MSPKRTASASSSPRPPVVSARRASFLRNACSSKGLEVGEMSERLTDMGTRRFAKSRQQLWGPRRPPCNWSGGAEPLTLRNSAQEQPIRGVVGLVVAGVGQSLEELLKPA